MLRNVSRFTAGRKGARLAWARGAAPRQAVLSTGQTQRRCASTDQDVFLGTTNAAYIDEMYAAYQKDPQSVHASWRSYFKNLDNGVPSAKAFQAPPSLNPISQTAPMPSTPQHAAALSGSHSNMSAEVLNHLKAQMLVRAYQVRGHFHAKVDPLHLQTGFELMKETGYPKLPSELTPEHYGWNKPEDLEQEITLGPGILPRFGEGKRVTLKQLFEYLDKTYCSSYGIQYMHMPSRTMSEWIRENVEVPTPFAYTKEEKRGILDRLMWATVFEEFLATKFPNDKRFGLEGGESMVPGLKFMIDILSKDGVEDIFIGMPHRGRLNVLSNVVRKPNENIFAEFHGSTTFDEGSGDVKYHLGMNYQRPTNAGGRITLSLVANPSHLEAEDPIVLGLARAAQHAKKDTENHEKSVGVLLHGDAAVAGQGVVYETLTTHTLPNYGTGGSIHVIVNNQIGFTTLPTSGRSTAYPSDFAKTTDTPVFHVNGDDIEACVYIFELAAKWRAQFKRDVIVDMFCYRKHGHNEIDQPAFTQPLMYEVISKKRPALEIYEEKLLKEGSFTKAEIQEHRDWVWGILEKSFAASKDFDSQDHEHWVAAEWVGFKTAKELATEILDHHDTSIDTKTFTEVGQTVSSWPKNFNVHRILQRILNARKKSIEDGEGIDMATGEALAFGSLIKEGYEVRVSGQDVERGTFSQRHAVLHDQKDGSTYTPLTTIGGKDSFTITNSPLSEYGILGFEYGYSLHDPRSLVIWEAQFGDFANTAQVISDQFIASGESKWNQRSGIVLSLPHGYDGQGPEHSSARLERYLLLGDEDPRFYPSAEKLQRQHQDSNMAIAYPSTPANLFHLLRRQMHREFRKPLIMVWSKSLLRHPLARSTREEFTGPDAGFKWIIDDPELGKSINEKDGISRLILCTGQVYAALNRARADNNVKDIALLRIEQLHPFPFEQLKEAFDSYPNLQDIVWTQEEPLNAGAWLYVSPRLEVTLKETEKYSDLKVSYTGRDPSASVAAGAKKMHTKQENAFLKDALKL